MSALARPIDQTVAGSAAIHTQGHKGESLMLLDARPRVRWTESEIAEALEKQQRRAGPLVALVLARLESTWSEIRRELNEAAGGHASARVMVLAHHALRAQQALELTALLAEVAAGERDAGEKKGDPLNALRNQSGLSVIATQALNQAYEAARAEHAANKGSATDQLMARLGHGVAATPERSALAPPVEGGGHVASGSLSPSIPGTYEVLGAPITPVPGDSK